MRRTLFVAAACVLFAAAAAGQTQVSVAPGLVDASSSLHGFDRAVDEAAVGIGLMDPGQVAHERASEAHVALEAGDTEAAQRSVDGLNEVAQVATSNSTQGLEKAQAVLEAPREQTPDQADIGIDQALDAVEQAKQRKPVEPGENDPDTPSRAVTGTGA